MAMGSQARAVARGGCFVYASRGGRGFSVVRAVASARLGCFDMMRPSRRRQ